MLVTRWRQSARAQTSSATASPARARWLPYMVVLLLIEALLMMHMLPQDFVFLTYAKYLKERIAAPAREAEHARWLASLVRKDPPVGSRLLTADSAPMIAAAHSGPPTSPVLIVFMGACTGCATRDLFELRALTEDARKPVVIVSRDERRRIDSFVRSHGFPIPIICDAGGTLARSFNSVWTPRAYLLDRKGNVRWIQTDDRMQQSTILRTVWGKGKV
jgi:peroxiredoxin